MILVEKLPITYTTGFFKWKKERISGTKETLVFKTKPGAWEADYRILDHYEFGRYCHTKIKIFIVTDANTVKVDYKKDVLPLGYKLSIKEIIRNFGTKQSNPLMEPSHRPCLDIGITYIEKEYIHGHKETLDFLNNALKMHGIDHIVTKL